MQILRFTYEPFTLPEGVKATLERQQFVSWNRRSRGDHTFIKQKKNLKKKQLLFFFDSRPPSQPGYWLHFYSGGN
ncbi:hypothetical protein GDO81_007141 [Engystomops pustulosus]|uniref:Uncharacterized protein n=1 Tax=Engystomops pustulosus TaxID=76066 RepID=A0AAV7C553_ENGPU|nr:hypothetical protein GDO81_007141 [Engystomops pustulosus]